MPTSAIEIHVPNAESVTITDDALTVALSDGRTLSPEFEEPRHTLASSRRKIKENQGDLLLFCHET